MTSSISRKPLVLIIDDEPLLLEMMASVLESKCDVLTAKTGEKGLRLFKEKNPDLVIVDLNMPHPDGYAITEYVKSVSYVPVVVVSGNNQSEKIIQALRAGAVNYYIKPIEKLEAFAEVICQHVANKWLMDSCFALQATLEQQVEERTALYEQEKQGVKSAQGKLSIQVKLLEKIIAQIPHAVFWKDKNLIYRGANKVFAKLFVGIDDPGKIVGRSVFDLDIPLQTANLLHAQDVEVLKTGRPATIEIQITGPSGSEISVQTTKSRLENGHGKIEGLVGVSLDMTKQKLTEMDLHEREAFLRDQNAQLLATLSDRYKFGEIVGKSQIMQNMYDLILSAGYSQSNILLRGEHGSGRKLVGKTICQQSRRKESGFEYLDCELSDFDLRNSLFGSCESLVPSGKNCPRSAGALALADRGTLYLDGIEKLSLKMQGELLEALTHGYIHPVSNEQVKVDVRLICATSENLRDLVIKGLMRQEFLFFVQVIVINVPALRERKEDIPLLADFFLKKYTPELAHDIDPAIIKALQDYEWPGNIREFQNTIQRYASLGRLDFLGPSEHHQNNTLTDYAPEEWESLSLAVENLEKTMILKALDKCDWHQSRTAEYLGIDRKTLAKKMKGYHLLPKRKKDAAR
ncbi:MAG: PAS modulated sigma54 specific transcriptional regulator, Fis family [uncultured bacterium]|nr:MAG: PAS modulated sigma54 specific transcriptional regulator, Fis family [uncultured bacterium]